MTTLTPERRAENMRLIKNIGEGEQQYVTSIEVEWLCAAGRAVNDLPLYEAALAEALNLLDRVYQQAGNAAPAERRHALTPGLRDEIRDYLKAAGYFGEATP